MYKAFIFISLFFCISCRSEDDGEKNTAISPNKVVEYVADYLIVPNYQQFHSISKVFSSKIKTFCDETPRTGKSFRATQDQWKITSKSWNKAGIFHYGYLRNQLDLRKKINNYSDFVTADLNKTNTGGLPALEFLLFDTVIAVSNDRFANNATGNTNCSKALTIAQTIESNAQKIENAWVITGSNEVTTFKKNQEDSTFLINSFSQIYQSSVFYLQDIIELKIAKPVNDRFDNPGNGINIGKLESPNGRYSIQNIQTDLQVIYQYYEGATGLNVYLRSIKQGAIAGDIKIALDDSITKSKAITSLYEAIDNRDAKLSSLISSLDKLYVLLSVDLANKLNVTLGTNDNDGD